MDLLMVTDWKQYLIHFYGKINQIVGVWENVYLAINSLVSSTKTLLSLHFYFCAIFEQQFNHTKQITTTMEKDIVRICWKTAATRKKQEKNTQKKEKKMSNKVNYSGDCSKKKKANCHLTMTQLCFCETVDKVTVQSVRIKP